MSLVQDFIKLARSIDSKRAKQYWQLLKRMHGGTDNAVKYLRRTGDSGIYHGTREDSIPSIVIDGLKPGNYREFGKGTFFGSKETAEHYSRTKFVDPNGFELGNFNGTTRAEAIKFRAENRDTVSGYELSSGDTVRLKKPSELKGTKYTYPNVNSAMVFDLDKGSIHDVAHAPMIYCTSGWRGELGVRRIRKSLGELPDDAIINTINKLPPESKNRALKVVERNREVFKSTAGATPELAQEIYKSRFEPRTLEESKKLQYHGVINGKKLFEHAGAPERSEFFFKNTRIAPELISHPDAETYRENALNTKKIFEAIPTTHTPTPTSTQNIKVEDTSNTTAVTQNIPDSPVEKTKSNSAYYAAGGALALGTGAYALHKYRNKEDN